MPNHLKTETSPYLQQHADNPVHWFPWCEEAFHKARTEDKPIFLSIGYSTCHWCHVMARESFEDSEVSELLNRYFISIKVDREERPDIDAVYMAACQAFTGSGGWPLTIFMTPDQKPFYAGTYFPKFSRYGNAGLLELLPHIAKMWEKQRGRLLAAGEHMTLLLQETAYSNGTLPDEYLILKGVSMLKNTFDPQWGGFGRAPKFPAPHNLMFLMHYAVLTGDDDAMHCAVHTLENMFQGGIFDHIGGGFSRYSTDDTWLIPHFEKMLYDNALLIDAYTTAYHQTGRAFCLHVIQKTADYIFRELTDPKGGFYCGQDADSGGTEGSYYLLTPGEIIQYLGTTSGRRFCEWFHITESGNFEGKNIPNLIGRKNFLNKEMEPLCKEIYSYRLARHCLHKDDKILTSWNAMMISALAKAGFYCANPKYLQAAKKAQRFLEQQLYKPDGRLYICYRAPHEGLLDDYAFYAKALLELYFYTFEFEYLKKAEHTARRMMELFWDKNDGGFYLYANDSKPLIVRPKETYDGAVPSGNSAAAHVLALLAAVTGEESWSSARDKQFVFLASSMADAPAAYCSSLDAMCHVLYPSAELICVSSEPSMPDEAMEFLRMYTGTNLTVLFKSPENEAPLARLAPFTANYPIPPKGTRYYLCQNNTCSAPAENIAELFSKNTTD